jgi:hypothetical protein
MASFWMTGRSTLGNPLVLLSFAVLGREHASLTSTALAIAAVAVGSGVGAALGCLLFPSGRRALSLRSTLRSVTANANDARRLHCPRKTPNRRLHLTGVTA